MQSYLIVTFIKFTDLLRSLVQCNPRNIEILTVCYLLDCAGHTLHGISVSIR